MWLVNIFYNLNIQSITRNFIFFIILFAFFVHNLYADDIFLYQSDLSHEQYQISKNTEMHLINSQSFSEIYCVFVWPHDYEKSREIYQLFKNIVLISNHNFFSELNSLDANLKLEEDFLYIKFGIKFHNLDDLQQFINLYNKKNIVFTAQELILAKNITLNKNNILNKNLEYIVKNKAINNLIPELYYFYSPDKRQQIIQDIALEDLNNYLHENFYIPSKIVIVGNILEDHSAHKIADSFMNLLDKKEEDEQEVKHEHNQDYNINIQNIDMYLHQIDPNLGNIIINHNINCNAYKIVRYYDMGAQYNYLNYQLFSSFFNNVLHKYFPKQEKVNIEYKLVSHKLNIGYLKLAINRIKIENMLSITEQINDLLNQAMQKMTIEDLEKTKNHFIKKQIYNMDHLLKMTNFYIKLINNNNHYYSFNDLELLVKQITMDDLYPLLDLIQENNFIEYRICNE